MKDLCNETKKSKGQEPNKKDQIDTKTHYYYPLKPSKKKTAMWGVLEDGTKAILYLDKGTVQYSFQDKIPVVIKSKGPQGSKIVEKVSI